MVAQLLRLKLRLLGNNFQRGTWQIIGLILGLAYGLAAATFGVASLVGLRLADAATAGSIVTVAGSVLVLGFVLVPLVFGVDDTMDPRKFSLFGISTRRLSSGLAVAALVGIPSLVVIAIAVAQVITWTRGPLPVFLALVGVVVIVATCVLAARVSTSIAAFFLSSRRARETTGVLGLLVLLLLSPTFVLLVSADWTGNGDAVLRSLADVLGWTPLGAVWAAPADAAAGRGGEAVLETLIGVAFAALLWLAWRNLVELMLVTPHREVQAKVYHGLGWFEVFPGNATGVIAARSLTYWGRDSRYQISLFVIPIVPLIMIVPLLVAGVPSMYLALIPVPVMALFLSWSIHNDVAYDNTAVWLHVVSDVPGYADRLGRAIPALLVGVPLILIGSVVSAQLYGDADIFLSVVGVSLSILLSGLGLSSIMSARFPYPVVRPGDSPFSQPQAVGTASSLIQSASFLATLLLAVPALGLGVLGVINGGYFSLWSLLVGAGIGVVVFVVGVLWGGHIFVRRAPEILAFSMRN